MFDSDYRHSHTKITMEVIFIFKACISSQLEQ